jgi:hypothetical protein
LNEQQFLLLSTSGDAEARMRSSGVRSDACSASLARTPSSFVPGLWRFRFAAEAISQDHGHRLDAIDVFETA